jgi:cell volume regulation protein A
MGIGAALGLGLGLGMAWLVNRLKLEGAAFYPVLATALVLLIYGPTASLHSSGFLAVYLAGLVLGNSHVAERHSLALFYGGFTALMETAMFLSLGLLVYPSHLPAIAGVGLLITRLSHNIGALPRMW